MFKPPFEDRIAGLSKMTYPTPICENFLYYCLTHPPHQIWLTLIFWISNIENVVELFAKKLPISTLEIGVGST